MRYGVVICPGFLLQTLADGDPENAFLVVVFVEYVIKMLLPSLFMNQHGGTPYSLCCFVILPPSSNVWYVCIFYI